jgi:hypothetical protein
MNNEIVGHQLAGEINSTTMTGFSMKIVPFGTPGSQ